MSRTYRIPERKSYDKENWKVTRDQKRWYKAPNWFKKMMRKIQRAKEKEWFIKNKESIEYKKSNDWNWN